MKTPRARKGRGKHGRKLGKVTLDTEKSLNDSFGEELKEIPGHFMYNEENDAIQQVLKLPDISVSDGSEHKGGNKRDLSLPPTAAKTKALMNIENKPVVTQNYLRLTQNHEIVALL